MGWMATHSRISKSGSQKIYALATVERNPPSHWNRYSGNSSLHPEHKVQARLDANKIKKKKIPGLISHPTPAEFACLG